MILSQNVGSRMRGTLLAGLITTLAGTATANVLAKECRYEPAAALMFSFCTCKIQNMTDTAVAAFNYSVVMRDPDRTVPWFRGDYSSPGQQWPVSGGIEPGEIREITFQCGKLSPDANLETVVIEVDVLSAFDENVDTITID